MSTPEQRAEELEKLSSTLHDIYQQEAHRRGDVRHPDRYEDLSEATKEWDRVLARWILTRLGAKDKIIADEHQEAEHYRLEASNVYLANENLQEAVTQLRSQLAQVTDIMKMSKLSLEIFLTRGDFAEDDRPKIKRWLASIDSWIAQAERKG